MKGLSVGTAEEKEVDQIRLIDGICKSLENQGIKQANTRQMNAVIQAANDIVAAFHEKHKPASDGMGLDAWLLSDDTGLSSKYLASMLAKAAGVRNIRIPPEDRGSHPYDPADFGRCVRMLRAAPELRQHLGVMADGHGAVWAGLVAVWNELETLYDEEYPTGKAPKLYERIKAIRDAAEKSTMTTPEPPPPPPARPTLPLGTEEH